MSGSHSAVPNCYTHLILVSDAEMGSLGLSYSNKRHVELITSASLLLEANCNEGFRNPTHSSVTLSCVRRNIDYLTNKFLTLGNRNVHHQQTKALHWTPTRNMFNFSCLHSQSKERPLGSSCSVEGYVNPKNHSGNNGCRQQNSFDKSDIIIYGLHPFTLSVILITVLHTFNTNYYYYYYYYTICMSPVTGISSWYFS